VKISSDRKEVGASVVVTETTEYVGGGNFKNDPYSIRTYGYSAGDVKLCLELCETNILPNLLATQLYQAKSEADVEAIVREVGTFRLWQMVNSTGIVTCEEDGNYAAY